MKPFQEEEDLEGQMESKETLLKSKLMKLERNLPIVLKTRCQNLGNVISKVMICMNKKTEDHWTSPIEILVGRLF